MTDLARLDEPQRCRFSYRGGPQCCRLEGHDGQHSYKCAAPNCPGRPWPASEQRHPYGCGEEPRE